MREKKKKMINVIGLGYIGLPTALIFSSNGFDVIGTDKNTELIKELNSGVLQFKEKGLEELINKAKKNKIVFTTNFYKANFYIVAVPTPYNKNDKKLDPSYVIDAIEKILEVCDEESIIIIESTISPGTTDKYIRKLVRKSKKIIHLVHAPERIIPGNMIYELKHNSRTIGSDSKKIGELVKKLYKKITFGDIILTDIKTAEMTKVVENTFRAVNIAFANELSKICNYDNLDVFEIIRICNMHPRVNILNPGPGVGGHCIPIDPWFLVGDYPLLTKLTKEALVVNNSMPEYVLIRLANIIKENNFTNFSRIGIYGLTYKENVDDYRESPTIKLLESQNKYLPQKLKVYDPLIKSKIVDNQFFDFDDFLNEIDIVVVMVKHDEIKLKEYLLTDKIVFDTQNVIKSGKIYKL